MKVLDRGRCLLEELPRIKTDACSENGGPDALGEMANAPVFPEACEQYQAT